MPGADGAHLGLSAEQALGVIVGGKPVPPPAERSSTEALRLRLLAAHARNAPGSYVECADLAGGIVLSHLLAHPEDARLGEDELYTVLRESLAPLQLTGFMWGWALNAARACCELEPVPNPAIVEVSQ
ncbi:MAG: hypothetical protein JWM85_1113 [Acidimicrobiaceae bacterium]|nr:hypothetical protein [Acidimicrobiaceae bacterium]